MRKVMIRTFAALLPALALAGCGTGFGGVSGQDSRINAATAMGPHGGQAIPLPDNKGFAEILIESPGRKASPRARFFAVYFVGPDLKTPLTTPPSGVSLKLSAPEETSLALSASPSPKDPAGAARFASAEGVFDADEYRGEVTASVDGQSFSKPFAIR